MATIHAILRCCRGGEINISPEQYTALLCLAEAIQYNSE
jgi:hypothetical protein